MLNDTDAHPESGVVLAFPSGARILPQPVRDPFGMLEALESSEGFCLVDGCVPVEIAEKLLAHYRQLRAS